MLEVVQLIRTDIPGIPALLLSQLSDISIIAYTHTFDTTVTGRVPTCIALSARVMELMQALIAKHIDNPDIYLSSAVTHVLTALEVPMNLKYAFPPPPKRPGQWVFATKAVLGVAERVLPEMDKLPDVTDDIKRSVWDAMVKIVRSIVRAPGNEIVDEDTLRSDEIFDIESFVELRKLIIPGLGRPIVPHDTIERYVRAVFWASLLYKTDTVEDSEEENDDEKWLKPRYHGATTELFLERRKGMAYVCMDELFSLVAASSAKNEDLERLAEIAAPWLIRRVGMVLGYYVAVCCIRR